VLRSENVTTTFLCVEVAARAFTREYYTNSYPGVGRAFADGDKRQLLEALPPPVARRVTRDT